MVARALTVVAALLAVLATGVWVGGRHPDLAPGFLVGGSEARVVARAIEEVNGSFFREVPEGRLADLAIQGMVDGLDDRFSTYFDPREYAEVKLSQRSEFSGIGVQVTGFPPEPGRDARAGCS
jgi:carboxyl-terminal processing protease